MTYVTGRRNTLEAVALKIIYLYMDCSVDCLYRVKLEAPIMEVIDEAVEESGVRGVLVGPYDLVRRHRDHDGRPAGAGVRDDRLARMGGLAGADRVRALPRFRAARRRRGRPHEPEEDHGGLRCHRRVPAGRHSGRGRPSSARHGAGAHRRARHRHGLRVVRRGQLRHAARPRRPGRPARRGQPHRLVGPGRAAVRADDRGRPADRHDAVRTPSASTRRPTSSSALLLLSIRRPFARPQPERDRLRIRADIARACGSSGSSR